MDLNRIPLFQMMSRRMGWLSDRQRVLADNIANVDTPGYQSRDLRPLDFRRELAQSTARLTPVSTDARHIAPRAASGVDARSQRTRPTETTISGNTVTVEQEMMKAGETANDYQLATTLYRRHMGLLRTVLSRGPG
jgi:flagellar basal-body rod protein FlgB